MMADAVEWMRQQWVEKKQPDPEHFAAMAAMLRTYQLMMSGIDAALKPHDLNRTGYLLMTSLQMARDSTVPLGRLSKQLLVHPTTITMVCDQLEKRGLVERRPHPTDRRTVLATLTQAGLAAVKAAHVALSEVQYGLTDVTPQLAVALTEILRTVRVSMDDI